MRCIIILTLVSKYSSNATILTNKCNETSNLSSSGVYVCLNYCPKSSVHSRDLPLQPSWPKPQYSSTHSVHPTPVTFDAQDSQWSPIVPFRQLVQIPVVPSHSAGSVSPNPLQSQSTHFSNLVPLSKRSLRYPTEHASHERPKAQSFMNAMLNAGYRIVNYWLN